MVPSQQGSRSTEFYGNKWAQPPASQPSQDRSRDLWRQHSWAIVNPAGCTPICNPCEIGMPANRPVCPTCNTESGVGLVWSSDNILQHFVNFMMRRTVGFPSGRVFYRCRSCGQTFTEQSARDESKLCVGCGYNLAGNESGTCPECGRYIPEGMRSRLALEDANADRSSGHGNP